MVSFSSSFYKRLKQKREAAGLSQKALASKLGITSAAVSRWEGADGMPSEVNLKRLAEVLNTSVDFFLNVYPSEDDDSAASEPVAEERTPEDKAINEIILETRAKIAAKLGVPIEGVRIDVKLSFPVMDA